MGNSTARNTTVDALRGIASLAVCWYHLTNGNPTFLQNGLLKMSGFYGWIGVEIFFVISGFVIPYSLFKGGYHLADLPRFVWKRIIRLDPPYLVTIALILALGYLGSHIPGFRGEPFSVNAIQLVLHLGYLNVFFGYPWLDVVFWTLAIELQYYLLMSLIYPLISSRRPAYRYGCLFLLNLSAIALRSESFIFHWLPIFSLGILVFCLSVGLIKRYEFIFSMVVCTAIVVWLHGLLIAAIVLATALIIVLVRTGNPVLSFLGTISYSLYLLHVPIGGRIINLGSRLAATDSTKIAVLIFALVSSIVAAYLLYLTVEKPSQKLSSRIRYRASDDRSRSVSVSASDPALVPTD